MTKPIPRYFHYEGRVFVMEWPTPSAYVSPEDGRWRLSVYGDEMQAALAAGDVELARRINQDSWDLIKAQIEHTSWRVGNPGKEPPPIDTVAISLRGPSSGLA